MNLLDLILLIFAAVLALLGAVRGLIRLLLAGAALAVAWWLATRFHQPVGEQFFGATEGAWGFAAFLVVLALSAVVALLAARLIARMVRATPLRGVDRLLGAGSGLVLATILAAAFLLPLQVVLSPSHPLVTGSALAPYLLQIGRLLEPLVPGEVREALREAGRSAEAPAGGGGRPGLPGDRPGLERSDLWGESRGEGAAGTCQRVDV